MNSPDGPEQRTADLEERFDADFDALVFDGYERDIDDADVAELLADDAIDSVEADHHLEVSLERGNVSVHP